MVKGSNHMRKINGLLDCLFNSHTPKIKSPIPVECESFQTLSYVFTYIFPYIKHIALFFVNHFLDTLECLVLNMCQAFF